MSDESRNAFNKSSKGGVDEVDALIVGAGFAGLYMLYRARKLGLKAVVFEAASDVGGTWWWNRYPGARCDIESMQYSYSWDDDLQQEWNWTERFATQPEILRYLEHVADRFDLRRDITFSTRVKSAAYDETARRWTVVLDQGSSISTQFLITAVGCLSNAQIPDFPGREEFTGETYHTGYWPHEGVDLAGKRVGVIGTGSSGIQVIPEIARKAEHLTVFQRTPNFSIPARNQPLNHVFVRGWKASYPELREYARRSTPTGTLYDEPSRSALDDEPEQRDREYRWRWEKGGVNFSYAYNDLTINEEANVTAANFVRERIQATVKDPETAEKLCPRDYPIFAKRICLDTEYFETFNRKNVDLVDLRKTPLKAIERKGIRTSDDLIELDTIVYATGFDAITGAITAMDIRGRDNRSISDKWTEGPRAYLGLACEGFPNLFMITGPGSPSVLSNVVVSIEQHVEWISGLLGTMLERGIDEVEAQFDAEEAWVAHVNEVAAMTLLPRAASWYMGANIPGKPRVFMPYIGVANYRKKCEEVAASDYKGFNFSKQTTSG